MFLFLCQLGIDLVQYVQARLKLLVTILQQSILPLLQIHRLGHFQLQLQVINNILVHSDFTLQISKFISFLVQLLLLEFDELFVLLELGLFLLDKGSDFGGLVLE